ncbi:MULTISPECIES: hypothetical protein [Exiguobacterium]|uniref:hypothetical protein n=1 Tax=Exiguobacterium TaxID=33986 RepID=UPI00047DC55D|nr:MULTISPECIES: hypothetical protein [Exiguobacterium]MCT4780214.1 hypothetical protein [Exiguobacterium soli]
MEALDRLKDDLANSADWNVTITVSKKDLEKLVALVTTDEQRDVAIATSEGLEEGTTREHAAERVTVGKHDIVFECR